MVLYVEDNPDWRRALARQLRVDQTRSEVEGHRWVSTDDTVRAAQQLRDGAVKVLVLDLSLNNDLKNWDMIRVLGQFAVKQPLAPEDRENFVAYRLAVLAHEKRVPCALLSGFADADLRKYANGLTSEQLCQAFNAEAVFTRDELANCAAWVRKKLGLA